MGEFNPDMNAIREIEETLVAAQTDRNALEHLNGLAQNPEYFAYCACILANENGAEYQLCRSLAAYQIKNNIFNPNCTNNPIVQQYVLQGLGDADAEVRRAISTIVTAAINHNVWAPQIVDDILPLLRGDESAVSGGIRALAFIIEDHIELLDGTGVAERLINAIVPFLAHGVADARAMAVQAVAIFMEQAGIQADGCSYVTLGGQIGSVVEMLLQNVSNAETKAEMQHALKALVLSLTYWREVEPQFDQIGVVMLEKTEDNTLDEDIRKEAVEFWRAVVCFPNFADRAVGVMDRIIPTIMSCMVYSDIELTMLGAKQNDWDVEDRPQDVKPRHYEGREHRTHADGDDDDLDDGDDEVEQWNLRRVAAITLDELAEYYGDNILGTVLDVVGNLMKPEQDWRMHEAAVLVIGAVADGCYVGMMQFLPSCVDQLCGILENDNSYFLTQGTALWAISKYPNYLTDPSAAEALARYVQLILKHMQSGSKMVQEYAVGALQDVADACTEGELAPFAEEIINTVATCFGSYQLVNRYYLFEAVQQLCVTLGSQLSEENLLNTLVGGSMTQMWQSMNNDDPLILPFFRCMSFICEAVGPYIEPMSADIFSRAYQMATWHLDARSAAANSNGQQEAPEPEYLVVALDLLSGIIEAMGSAIEPQVMSNEPNFMNYMLQAVMDAEDPQIRRSGLAVLSDMCNGCVTHVQQFLDQVLQAILNNMENPVSETRELAAASNAAWLLGELLTNQIIDDNNAAVGPEHLVVLFPKTVNVLGACENSDRSVAENASLALGRMLYIDPSLLQQSGTSVEFLGAWLESMRKIKNIPQKDQAVRGMLQLAEEDPAIMIPGLPLWFDLFVSLSPAPDLAGQITGLLKSVQQNARNDWNNAKGQYSKNAAHKLYQMYSVQ